MRGKRLGLCDSPAKISVDLRALRSIQHGCDDLVGGEGGECCRTGSGCCDSYDVEIGRGEMRRIIALMPEASELCPWLKVSGEPDTFHNVFEPVPGGGLLVERSEEGRCAFAFERDGRLQCSLHTVAEVMSIPVERAKPLVCTLWPLALVDEGVPILTVQHDAFEYGCNTGTTEERSLHRSIGSIVEMVFGLSVRTVVEEAVRQGRDEIDITL